MFNKFFTRFMQQSAAPNILQNDQFGDCLNIQELENFSEPCLLRVAPTQQACLLQNGWRSPMYREGEHAISSHTLTALDPKMALSVIFINAEQYINRTWQHQTLHIQGQYQLRVLQGEHFLSHLLSLSPSLDLMYFDHWISLQIHSIIQEQQISRQDLQDYPQRLALFLKDVLNARPLAPCGLHLEDLSVQYVESTHAQETSLPEPSAIEPFPEPIAPIVIDEGPLEFYCAMNGQQQGPYSRYGLQQLINSGQIHPQTLVWKLGLPSWQPLQQLTEFYWHDTPSHD